MKVKEIIALATEQTTIDHYCTHYKKSLETYWKQYLSWCEQENIYEFSEERTREYCLKNYGSDRPTANIERYKRYGIRAVLKLIEIFEIKEFATSESRNREKDFHDRFGVIDEFREFLKNKNIKPKTIYKKMRIIEQFLIFLKVTNQDIQSINYKTPEQFCNWKPDYSLDLKTYILSVLRQLFQWLYNKNIVEKDFSDFSYIVRKPKRNESLIFSPEDVRLILSSIDRSSNIGKRDYLILLMISLYGLRAGEIADLKCSDIDWKANVINVFQQKTQNTIKLPLLPEIGNAIIDYYKFSRPEHSKSSHLFVSLHGSHLGNRLSGGSVYHMFCNVLRSSGLNDWWKYRHGTHTLRFSLATNLLSEDISIHVIQNVLGHRDTNTTMQYIKGDYENLRKCCLAMPQCKSFEYQSIERWEK